MAAWLPAVGVGKAVQAVIGVTRNQGMDRAEDISAHPGRSSEHEFKYYQLAAPVWLHFNGEDAAPPHPVASRSSSIGPSQQHRPMEAQDTKTLLVTIKDFEKDGNPPKARPAAEQGWHVRVLFAECDNR